MREMEFNLKWNAEMFADRDEVRHNFKTYLLNQKTKDGTPYKANTANTMSQKIILY